MRPDWIATKPKHNDGTVPVLEVNYKILPTIAEGIWHAQMAGWERILTDDYVQDTQQRKMVRRLKREQIEMSGLFSEMRVDS